MPRCCPRAELDVEAAIERVRPICDDVRHRGAAAVREYTLRFDGVDLATTRVPAAALAGALAALAPDLRAALEETIRRLRLVCRAQRPADVVTSIGAGSHRDRAVCRRWAGRACTCRAAWSPTRPRC